MKNENFIQKQTYLVVTFVIYRVTVVDSILNNNFS